MDPRRDFFRGGLCGAVENRDQVGASGFRRSALGYRMLGAVGCGGVLDMDPHGKLEPGA